MANQPTTLCVLLWAHPGQESALVRYEDRVLQLITDHGGQVLQRGTVQAPADEAPTEVQWLIFPGDDALDAYLNDPRRQALIAERDEAIARTDVLRIQPSRC
ncbi:DUF1330 domain-containing protein [Nocardia testacea]|uniref:DUF1330 domain-containing protein n=1 Tax=Nocardia testacea TaxID=248551 RepID=UPI0002DB1293|nr:DUF1330 domain-containing protein [Nocardia testacea]